jgi:hypothetical protein
MRKAARSGNGFALESDAETERERVGSLVAGHWPFEVRVEPVGLRFTKQSLNGTVSLLIRRPAIHLADCER